jgi:hypothetical protein
MDWQYDRTTTIIIGGNDRFGRIMAGRQDAGRNLQRRKKSISQSEREIAKVASSLSKATIVRYGIAFQ